MLTEKEREIFECIIKEIENRSSEVKNRDIGLILVGIASGIDIIAKNSECEITTKLSEGIFKVAQAYIKSEN